MADDDDSETMYICHACVGDAFLKDEIRRQGHKQECHFCGKTRKAWPLEELAERVQGVIEQHFQITPSDPRDEGLVYDKDMDWERRGDPVADVIAEIAGLEPDAAEAVRDRISEKTSWDAYEGAYEDPFGSERCVPMRIGEVAKKSDVVRFAEYPPMTLTWRWDDRPRQRIVSHMTKAMTWGVTKPMTKAATSIEQLALRRLRLGLEPRPPVLEPLQRDALRLAILPLIQVAALPCLMVCPPEGFALAHPRSVLVRHLVLSSSANRGREQIASEKLKTSVREMDAYSSA